MKTTELFDRIVEERTPQFLYRNAIGRALNPNYYQGTVADATKAKRRAKNKVARQSRKRNRHA